ncbi:MAG TPA: hypothetical protein VKD90_02160 [Gemmataceae bacterium]|nr:hypothetical protein [Gemmataceae bacterium]
MRPSLRMAAAAAVFLLSESVGHGQFIPAYGGFGHRQGVFLQVRNGPLSSFTFAASGFGYGVGPYYGLVPNWYYGPVGWGWAPRPYVVQPPIVVQNVIQVPPANGNGDRPPAFPAEFERVPQKNAPKAPAKLGPAPKRVEVEIAPDPPKAPPMPPRALGRADADRLAEAGRKAFADGQYGRALELFRKAAETIPGEPSAYYLVSQAQFALGKYRESVTSIAAGMVLRANWSEARFNSRDLYWKNPESFDDHLKALRQAVAAYSNDPALTFLLGHQLWFDGKQDEARPLIQKARDIAKGQTPAEAFQLK